MSKNGKGKIKIRQKLRGPKPNNVTGRMKPRQAIETIRRAQREGDLEDETACWKELEPYLRDS